MNTDIIVARRIARIVSNFELEVAAIDISHAIQELNRTQRFILRQAKPFTLLNGVTAYIEDDETTSLPSSLVIKVLKKIKIKKREK